MVEPSTPSSQTELGIVPVQGLSEAARSESIDAVARVHQEGKTDYFYKRQAAEVSKRSGAAPSDLRLLAELKRANADFAAAASRSCRRFPDEATVLGFPGLINLETAIARERDLLGITDAALDGYIRAMALVQQYRAYSRISSVDPMLYGIGSRAASAVGRLAGSKNLTLSQMLRALDQNIISPFSPLMSQLSLAPLKGFATVALLRQSLMTAPDPAYATSLKAEVHRLRAALTPVDPSARRRFESELDNLLGEIDIRSGTRARADSFVW